MIFKKSQMLLTLTQILIQNNIAHSESLQVKQLQAIMLREKLH